MVNHRFIFEAEKWIEMVLKDMVKVSFKGSQVSAVVQKTCQP